MYRERSEIEDIRLTWPLTVLSGLLWAAILWGMYVLIRG